MSGMAPPKSETSPARPRTFDLDGSESRPWSGLEAHEAEELILATWADAVDAEREIALEAAAAEHHYRLQKSLTITRATGKNAQEREAQAYLLMDAEAGEDAMHPRQSRDYWQALQRSQREKLQWLAQEARYAHSLVVDSRAGEGSIR